MSALRNVLCQFRRKKSCRLADFVGDKCHLLAIVNKDANTKNLEFIGFVGDVGDVGYKFSISLKK